MSSESLFVLAVSVLTLGGVFVYLLRIEALAKRLEERVRDDELEANIQTLDEPLTDGAATPQLPR